MNTRYKQKIDVPFGLHDMYVNKITIQNNSVHFQFENGYVSMQEPYPQVNGNLTIEKVDFDFACVLLLSKNGQYGAFNGRKMTLEEFLDKYIEFRFEIVDEMYGYNQVEYSGYLSVPKRNDLIQMSLSMYFNGDVIYETDGM